MVVRGNATFARGDAGPYRVGVTGTGSQVPPHADSDMLVVGGDLAAPGTPLVVGQGLGADAVVGGAVAGGAAVDLGGTLDQGVPSLSRRTTSNSPGSRPSRMRTPPGR